MRGSPQDERENAAHKNCQQSVAWNPKLTSLHSTEPENGRQEFALPRLPRVPWQRLGTALGTLRPNGKTVRPPRLLIP